MERSQVLMPTLGPWFQPYLKAGLLLDFSFTWANKSPHLLKTLVNMFNWDNFLFLTEKVPSWCHLRGHNAGIAVELKHALNCFLTEAMWQLGEQEALMKGQITIRPRPIAAQSAEVQLRWHLLGACSKCKVTAVPLNYWTEILTNYAWKFEKLLEYYPCGLLPGVTITKSPDFSDFSRWQWRSR